MHIYRIYRIYSRAFFGPLAEAKIGRLTRSRNAATSLALLCFLGAGHTHLKDGPYKNNVDQALKFLAQGSLLPTAAVHVEVLIVVCRSAGRGGDNTLMRLHLP